jgi:hypothetical protein
VEVVEQLVAQILILMVVVEEQVALLLELYLL